MVCACLMLGSSLLAQKIGYVNLEMVLAYMPETKTMEEKLKKQSDQLAQTLQVKRDYFQLKYQEATALAEAGASEEELQPISQELQKLQGELQQAAAVADQQLAGERQKMLAPILEKLQSAIKSMAAEGGYTYVFNSNASGVSVMLHGPDSDNLTKSLFTRLGIPIPGEG